MIDIVPKKYQDVDDFPIMIDIVQKNYWNVDNFLKVSSSNGDSCSYCGFSRNKFPLTKHISKNNLKFSTQVKNT